MITLVDCFMEIYQFPFGYHCSPWEGNLSTNLSNKMG